MARVRNSDSVNGRVSAARHASRCARVVALALVAVGGAACTPDPAPTPTPTYTCTANVGACTQQQAAKEAKAAKDHEAAKVSLQAGLTELYRILGQEGEIGSIKTLQRHFAEDELDSALDVLKEFRADKRVGHGSVSVVTATFETRYPSSEQSVVVCEDGTKFYTTDPAGKKRTPPGFFQKYTATLKLMDGQWKRTQSTEAVKVASCVS